MNANGELFTFGSNTEGQLGLGFKSEFEFSPAQVVALLDKPVKQISCGAQHMAALLQTGFVYLWGSNEFQQLSISVDKSQRAWSSYPRFLPLKQIYEEKVVDVCCGKYHTAILTSLGNGYVCGR